MSDETHEVAEQLFDTDQTEVAEEATDTSEKLDGTSDESNESSSDTEQEQEGLELEDKTTSKAEEKKLALIKSTQAKIDKGELSLDNLPKDKSWMKRYLKSSEKEVEVDHKAIAKEIAKEAFREEREELQFLDLKDSLNSLRLTADQKARIKAEFAEFLEMGVPRFKALAKAAEIAKVDFTGLSEKKRRMSIPQPSTKKRTNEIDESAMTFEEITKNFSPEKVAAYLKSQLR